MKRKTSPLGQNPVKAAWYGCAVRLSRSRSVARSLINRQKRDIKLPGFVGLFQSEGEAVVLMRAGKKIVYPSQGPCLIEAIVERIIDERPRMFYQLRVLNGGGDLFIPVMKVEAIGIRPLLNITEIPKLMAHLSQPVEVADNYRQRNLRNQKLFSTGSAFDLAEIVGSLAEMRSSKPLSFGEHKTLERAKELLACEIAEVMRTTKEAAIEQVEAAVGARAKKTQTESATRERLITDRNPIRYQTASG